MSALLRGAVPLTAVLAQACAQAPIGEGPFVTGPYRLEAVNGSPPPVAAGPEGRARVEITGGTLHLHADGSFADTLRLRWTGITAARPGLVVAEGRYEVAAREIRLFTTSGAMYVFTRVPGGALRRRSDMDADLTYTSR